MAVQQMINNKYKISANIGADKSGYYLTLDDTADSKKYYAKLIKIDTSSLSFGRIAERLENYGKESGMEIHIQREEIFDAMHRI